MIIMIFTFISIIAPAGISNLCSSRVCNNWYLQLEYKVNSILEKNLDCLNRGRTESLGNDDVLALNNSEFT